MWLTIILLLLAGIRSPAPLPHVGVVPQRAVDSPRAGQDIRLLPSRTNIPSIPRMRRPTGFSSEQLTSGRRNENMVLRHDGASIDARDAARLSRQRLLVFALIIATALLAVAVFALLRAQTALFEMNRLCAEHNRLLAETARREREGQCAFSRELLRAQEAERSRIAADLHDSLGQEIAMIKNRMMMALQHADEPDRFRAQIAQMIQRADAVTQSIRAIAHGLRPFEIDRIGLTGSIMAVVGDLEQSTSLRVHTEIASVDDMLTKEREILLYRVIQEALSNVVRHAAASDVYLVLKEDNGHLIVTIRDNGSGFDLHAATVSASGGTRGFGLHSMKTRVHMLDGAMRIDTAAGAGTRITIALPHPLTPVAEGATAPDVPSL